MREIWAVDSETDPFKAGRIPRPFLWGAYNGRDYLEFEKTYDLVTFLGERECLAYAHNGGKFDWHFLLDYLEPLDRIMVINGRLAKFKIGKCEFRDSWNIIPAPLAAYKKDDIDYNILEEELRYAPENYAKIKAYLKSDCVYLHEMVMAFVKEFGMHLTQAGASMHAWSKITGRKTPNTTPTFYAELSPYYYGGRVECFTAGEIHSPFKIIDVNSAYPFAMMSEHPYGNTIATMDTLPPSEEIGRCFIHLSAESLGALPARKKDKSLYFPADGTIRSFFITGWEYLAAKETGFLGNERIHSVKTLPEKIEFSAYLNHFYRMKVEAGRAGDKARYEFAKRFLNSLYGKTGANPANYEEHILVPPDYIEAAAAEDGYQFVSELGPHALVSRPLAEENQRFYNVAVAASVTGYVRAHLWRAIIECRKEGGKVHYCDTDCLFTERTGNLNIHPENLGAWDVEAECDYAAIVAKKLYAAKTLALDARGERIWKTASKGLRLERSQIVAAAKGKEVTYNSEAPTFSLKNGIQFISRTLNKSAAISTLFDDEEN